MKPLFLAGGLTLNFILQFFFLQSWQTSGLGLNLVLAYIVIVSLYATKEEMLWLALFAGLFGDLYSSSDFGLYLGFYLLTAIIAKYFLRVGDIDCSAWKPIVFLAFLSLVQGAIVCIPVYGSAPLQAVTTALASYVSLTVAAGVLWYLLLGHLGNFLSSIKATKILR